jgi:hypothetical protein
MKTNILIDQLMTQKKAKRTIGAFTWMLAASPYLLLLIFLTLAMHVRIGLGHWPEPIFENYHTTACILHEQLVVWVGMFTMFAAAPLWLASLFFRIFRISLKIHLMQAGAYIVGWALIILYTRIDPYKFAEWFFD